MKLGWNLVCQIVSRCQETQSITDDINITSMYFKFVKISTVRIDQSSGNIVKFRQKTSPEKKNPLDISFFLNG